MAGIEIFMIKNKIITRIKGGLGNQLFCYAAARRLSIVNDAELVIDDVTGFARDYAFQRQYALEHFNISCRKATPGERLEPLERYRRGVLKWRSRRKPFAERPYLEQEYQDFDARLLTRQVKGTLYLDGYWQSESYFKDVEATTREDLRITPPHDADNRSMSQRICQTSNPVALHVRWFSDPTSQSEHNLSEAYYANAIGLMEHKLDSPHYFLFSDNPEAARQKLSLPESRVTYVCHNQGDLMAYADLWLMSQCKHFIMANSTFSWWGAWLGEHPNQLVTTPNLSLQGAMSWGFAGLLPDQWIKM
jgi:Glycosyl transferase family 11